MKAILVREPGGPERLEIGEAPDPEACPGELLVRVKAAGVNRADVLQREGRYPPPAGASPILGLEIAGFVESVGPADAGDPAAAAGGPAAGGAAAEGPARGRPVAGGGDASRGGRWHPGDRVFGLVPGGGYAERAVLAADVAMPIPPGLGFEEAAAVPEVFLTSYQCLYWIGGLQPGWTVLIHAGASGVGTAAIQLVREAGATALATAGSAAKLDACRRLGAVLALNYKDGPFAPAVLDVTGGAGVELVLDFVGAAYWEQNVSCLRTDGRLVLIATLGGRCVERLDLGALLHKRLQVTGTTLRARSTGYKARLTQEVEERVVPGLADRRLAAVVDRVFPWEQAADAHRYMEANRTIGKLVLSGM